MTAQRGGVVDVAPALDLELLEHLVDQGRYRQRHPDLAGRGQGDPEVLVVQLVVFEELVLLLVHDLGAGQAAGDGLDHLGRVDGGLRPEHQRLAHALEDDPHDDLVARLDDLARPGLAHVRRRAHGLEQRPSPLEWASSPPTMIDSSTAPLRCGRGSGRRTRRPGRAAPGCRHR